ncbi:MAG TPA: retroviral-like aspartic protease family protein [Steroidobacteraceae bacterium]|nr:retroviral-like aspartic protease family protein [Steroidobacteraceae bacterium]
MKKWTGIAACLICLPFAPAAFGACKIGKIAELPVTVRENRPLLQGEINGQPIEILVDTGASASFMWEGAATRLGLKIGGVRGLRIFGVGGEATVHETVINLQIGVFTAKNLQIAVIRPKTGARADDGPALVLGEDFFSGFAAEFDLAHGVLRLLKPEGCPLDQLPYWADSYSMAELEQANPSNPQILIRVMLNGKPVDAILDTGAGTSVVARPIAANAGVTPWLDGKQTAFKTSGVSGTLIDSWAGMFATFAIGDESVRNVKLEISDLFNNNRVTVTGTHISQIAGGLPNMLIGCDFFLAHRILVLFNARKVLFTYNGGPIFQVVQSVESQKGAPAESAPAH